MPCRILLLGNEICHCFCSPRDSTLQAEFCSLTAPDRAETRIAGKMGLDFGAASPMLVATDVIIRRILWTNCLFSHWIAPGIDGFERTRHASGAFSPGNNALESLPAAWPDGQSRCLRETQTCGTGTSCAIGRCIRATALAGFEKPGVARRVKGIAASLPKRVLRSEVRRTEPAASVEIPGRK